MTLPSSGPLSMQAINTEFGRGTNLGSYRGTVWYTDAGASGTFTSTNLGFDQFYGKRLTAPTFSFSIASNQTNADLRSLALAAGWNGSSAVIATVNSGIYIYSTSTGTAGLTINGSWPGGVTLVNNGYIMGMGGAGGVYGVSSGTAGGSAISIGVNCTITNNSYIGGGGGGGASNGGTNFAPGGGGGAGGGAGGSARTDFNRTNTGGTGGGVGASGSNGAGTLLQWTKGSEWLGAGGGGGRIFPGTGGAGGSAVNNSNCSGKGGGSGGGGGGTGYGSGTGTGGAGGSGGSAGSGSTTYSWQSGGGGGWGASGANTYGGTAGSGGKAIALNGFTATRNGSGTTYGTVA